MTKTNLKGMGVALVTPFDKSGQVDYSALSNLVDYQIQNGTDYLVVLGTTGETPTLTSDEQRKVVETVLSANNGQLPIVLGVGGNNTQAVIENINNGCFKGIDAILSVVPYYNKPSQEGIYRHFEHIAEAAGMPVILYNVPSRTGVNMEAQTTLRLAESLPNIVAVKEASGDMEQIREIINRKPDRFQVISGDDGIALPLIESGGQGVISVIGNAFPKEFGRLVHLALKGDTENAAVINRNFEPLFELLFAEGNPTGIKCMLHLKGYIENELRLPLIPAQPALYKRIRNVMENLSFTT